jgi:hypothetical protein
MNHLSLVTLLYVLPGPFEMRFNHGFFSPELTELSKNPSQIRDYSKKCDAIDNRRRIKIF